MTYSCEASRTTYYTATWRITRFWSVLDAKLASNSIMAGNEKSLIAAIYFSASNGERSGASSENPKIRMTL